MFIGKTGRQWNCLRCRSGIEVMKNKVFNEELFLVFAGVYSYRRASIGSRSAAFLAGYHPKKIPVKVQTAKERSTLHGCMKTGQWATFLIIKLAPHPMRTPIKPPVILMRIDSIRN